jgi:anti-anti-sigma factor
MNHIISYEPVGSINAANVRNFQQQLMMAVNAKEGATILVDMKGVEFLDSAGLMALVTAYRQAQNLGKHLIICSVSPAVRIIFELSQLDQILKIFPTRYAFEASLNHSFAA